MQHSVEKHGFAMVRNVISLADVTALLSALGPTTGPGRRGLLSLPAVSGLVRSRNILDLVSTHLAGEPFPVRTIYFDKSPAANWLVSWHQDLTIALRARADAPGFGPWSTKEDIPHVQPPVGMLQQMLTVRIHLDDADDGNGALRVLPGTHLLGKIPPSKIAGVRAGQEEEVVCKASAGDVLLMRPLILHASGKSQTSRHRRILHIEYAASALPGELEWHEAA